jgi:hypothetical protein
MTNEELMDIFGFVSMKKIYDYFTTEFCKIRFIKNDGSYEDTHNLTMDQTLDPKLKVVNEYLSNKLYLMYEKRNSKIDKIINN